MNEKDETDMIDTPQLLAKLVELEKRLDASSKDRHRVNSTLQGTLGSMTNAIGSQDEVLSQIQNAVQSVAESVERIQACLIGDEKYKLEGLIKGVERIKITQIDFSTRLELFQDAIKTNAEELRTQKKTAIIVVSILGCIGAVIAWVQSTGFFRFLTK